MIVILLIILISLFIIFNHHFNSRDLSEFDDDVNEEIRKISEENEVKNMSFRS
ncbi:MAG: hypothetical protein FWD71_05320 [Oscillospiraceae bacterium]|nr:hypothetical protein [Oscillospiraceae bacterium]